MWYEVILSLSYKFKSATHREHLNAYQGRKQRKSCCAEIPMNLILIAAVDLRSLIWP